MRGILIEDDPTARAVLYDILEKNTDAKISEACDGTYAWETLEDSWEEGLEPDFAIVDISMPEMSGLELLEKIRADERFKSLPAVLCTSHSDRDTVVSASKLNISGYIVKPFSEAKVTDAVKVVIKKLSQLPWLDEKQGVCSRLGVDASTYKNLLHLYMDRISDCLITIRKDFMSGNVAKATQSSREALDSAEKIGANRLKSSIERLTKILDKQEFSQTINHIERCREIHKLTIELGMGAV